LEPRQSPQAQISILSLEETGKVGKESSLPDGGGGKPRKPRKNRVVVRRRGQARRKRI